MVHLITADHREFHIDEEVIERSLLVRGMFDVIGDRDEAIPLPDITGDVFEKILEYCEHYRGQPLPELDDQEDRTRRHTTDMNEWDRNFISVDQEMLFEIILASNYLDIRPLLDIACRKVAEMMKGKTVDQIRDLFNIVSDLTPEEEAEIIRANEWAFQP